MRQKIIAPCQKLNKNVLEAELSRNNKQAQIAGKNVCKL